MTTPARPAPAPQAQRPPGGAPPAAGGQPQQLAEAKTRVSPTVKPGDLITPILFVQGNVKQLKDSDFTIESRELICLKYDDCIAVLFYSDNKESTNLAKVWASVSSQVAGITFAAVHLGLEENSRSI